MNNDPESNFSMEQLVLEIVFANRLLNRIKDDTGLVTQWGSAAWLILQDMLEQKPLTIDDLAGQHHISTKYCAKLVKELESEGLLQKQMADNKEVYDITYNGKHALTRLHESLHDFMGNFEDQFKEAELQNAISSISRLRHLIENHAD